MASSSFWSGVSEGISKLDSGLAEKRVKDIRDNDIYNRSTINTMLYDTSKVNGAKDIIPDIKDGQSLQNYIDEKMMSQNVDLSNNESIAKFQQEMMPLVTKLFDGQIKYENDRKNSRTGEYINEEKKKVLASLNGESLNLRKSNYLAEIKRKERIGIQDAEKIRNLEVRQNLQDFNNQYLEPLNSNLRGLALGDPDVGTAVNGLLSSAKKQIDGLGLRDSEKAIYNQNLEKILTGGLINGFKDNGTAFAKEDVLKVLEGVKVSPEEKDRLANSVVAGLSEMVINSGDTFYRNDVDNTNPTSILKPNSVINKYPSIMGTNGDSMPSKMILDSSGTSVMVGSLFNDSDRENILAEIDKSEGLLTPDAVAVYGLAKDIEAGNITQDDMKNLAASQMKRDTFAQSLNIYNNPDYLGKDGKFSEDVFKKKVNLSSSGLNFAKSFVNKNFNVIGQNGGDVLNSLVYSMAEESDLQKLNDSGVSDRDKENIVKNGVKKLMKDRGVTLVSLGKKEEKTFFGGKKQSDNYIVFSSPENLKNRLDIVNRNLSGTQSSLAKVNMNEVMAGNIRETKKFIALEAINSSLVGLHQRGDMKTFTDLKEYLFRNPNSILSDRYLDSLTYKNGEVYVSDIPLKKYISNRVRTKVSQGEIKSRPNIKKGK